MTFRSLRWSNLVRLGLRLGQVGLLLALLAAAPGFAASDERELLDTLRVGGLNLYFRHAATDWTQQDRVAESGDWLSCDGEQIRQLSDAGRETARRIGEAMRQLQIPVSEVVASPYCRTMETARLLGLGDVRPSEAVINMRVADYFGGREAVIASARAVLSSPPPDDGNRVIVAHGNVALNATPVYPGEAEAVAFRPNERGGFEVVARLTPSRWAALAASVQTGAQDD